MSRIHDALKKAEEARERNRTPEPESPIQSASLESEQAVSEETAGVTDISRELQFQAVEPRVADGSTLLKSCRVGNWHPTTGALFLSGKGDHSKGLEEFRTLRSRLFQMRAKKPLKTILISSAVPGEGKSFVSSNLAQVFARQRGGRTLLIDCDLRKPQLHRVLGAPQAPGISEYLAGAVGEESIIQKCATEDLYFIAGGEERAGAAEMLGNGRLKKLIETLSPLFSWVIVDSSPVLPVSDPTRVAEFCDGVVLVVNAGMTPYPIAEKAKNEFRQCPILGVVLNRISESERPYSTYYSHYGETAKKN